jgi:hypothetical protein
MPKLLSVSPLDRIKGLTRSQTLIAWEKRMMERNAKRIKEEQKNKKPDLPIPEVRLRDT